MAECISETEKDLIMNSDLELPQKVLTGGDRSDRHLIRSLHLSMEHASGADLIVSFLMESGVRMLIEELKPLAIKDSDQNPDRQLSGDHTAICTVSSEA
jgi:HKD family nuclease